MVRTILTVLILPTSPMFCCGSSCKIPCDSKGVACLIVRVTFGLSALLIGLAHYGTIQEFSGFVAMGLGPLAPLGMLWGYILPGLMVIGGALLLAGSCLASAWILGIAFGSIIVGMLLKPLLGGTALGDVMPATINAYIYLFAYVLAVKCASCGCCGPEGKKK